MKLPITVIILAHDQTRLLNKAVSSVQTAKQILIVNTSEKVFKLEYKGANLQVIRYPQALSSFSHVRNWVLKQSLTDWVMFLDSDEELEADGLTQIAQTLKNSQVSALSIWRSDIFLGKQLRFGEAGCQSIPRIFHKDKVRYSGVVHETPEVIGQTIQTNILIKHSSHSSISQFLESVNSYAKLVAQEKINRNYSRVELPIIIWIKLITFPMTKLFFNLFIKQGIRDGWRGLVYGYLMSLHSLLVRIYQLEKYYRKASKLDCRV